MKKRGESQNDRRAAQGFSLLGGYLVATAGLLAWGSPTPEGFDAGDLFLCFLGGFGAVLLLAGAKMGAIRIWREEWKKFRALRS